MFEAENSLYTEFTRQLVFPEVWSAVIVTFLQRKRESAESDGEPAQPSTPSAEDIKKEKKKKKKEKRAKLEEAETEKTEEEPDTPVSWSGPPQSVDMTFYQN